MGESTPLVAPRDNMWARTVSLHRIMAPAHGCFLCIQCAHGPVAIVESICVTIATL